MFLQMVRFCINLFVFFQLKKYKSFCFLLLTFENTVFVLAALTSAFTLIWLQWVSIRFYFITEKFSICPKVILIDRQKGRK